MDLLLGHVPTAQLQRALSVATRGLGVAVVEDLDALTAALDGPEELVAGVQTCDQVGFDLGLAIYRAPDPWQTTEGLIELAALLHAQLKVDLLADAGDHAPTKAPYWSLLWTGGEVWLVDDYAIDAEEPGPVRKVERVVL